MVGSVTEISLIPRPPPPEGLVLGRRGRRGGFCYKLHGGGGSLGMEEAQAWEQNWIDN